MKMCTISGAKKWSETLDLFSHAVNDGKFHKLNYDAFRKLAKYHPVGDVINILRKDDGIITVVDPKTESGYLLWSGSEIDNSFGSFLYDKYFKENEKMNPNETLNATTTQGYDLWGNYASCGSAINSTDSYDWNGLVSTETNRSVSSYCSYPTPEEFKMLQKRVEELGKLCTDLEVDVHITRETLCSEVNQVIDEVSAVDDRKAEVGEVSNLYRNLDEVRKYADAVSYDVERALRDIDDNAADIHAMGDEIWNLRKMVEDLRKSLEGVIVVTPNTLTIQGTSSDVYPVKNHNFKADYMSGCDNRKDKENMDTNKIFNFDFGPVDSSVRMSLYGMAIKNASGIYVAYDAASKQVMDVDILNFEGANKFIYKMPAAIGDVKTGDVVIHARRPMFVQEVKPDNRLVVMDIYDGEEKTIVLSRSPFGFDFVTKVVSLVNFAGAATAGNPFGNMLPFLLMSDNKGDSDMLLPLLMMNQSGGTMNPLMMYALMSKDNKANDMLPFLLMSGNIGCGCNCNCNKE